jgi:hypothetical protein
MVAFIRYTPYLRQNDMDDDGRCGRNCRLAERYATILYAIIIGGEQIGRGEIASHRRIWAAYSGG